MTVEAAASLPSTDAPRKFVEGVPETAQRDSHRSYEIHECQL